MTVLGIAYAKMKFTSKGNKVIYLECETFKIVISPPSYWRGRGRVGLLPFGTFFVRFSSHAKEARVFFARCSRRMKLEAIYYKVKVRCVYNN